MKKIWMLIIAVSLLSGVTSVSAAKGDAPSDWAKASVQEALELGIVPERLQSNYQSPITRGEFAELVVRTVLGNQKYWAEIGRGTYWTAEQLLRQVHLDFEFEDAKQDYVKLAFILGSVNGVSDTKFAPDQYITRQEAATMIMNTNHVANGISYSSKEELNYSDFDEIADWAKPAVQTSASVGYMLGVGGKFDYTGKFTREQSIATMIRLFHDMYGEFTLRGNLDISPDYTELRYNIGKDYIKVSYEDDGEYTELDRFMHKRWNSHPVTSKDKSAFSMEKAIAIFAFGGEVRPTDFPGIFKPTMEGKPSKWDYGYMIVSALNSDSVVSFMFTPVKGYMSQINGYKFGYPFEKVTVKEIPLDRGDTGK